MRFGAAAAIATLMIVVPGRGVAETIHVPGDHDRIQAAIDASADGDTVLVQPGTYFEREIDFGGRAIAVAGTDPGDSAVVAATVVYAGGEGSVFYFHALEDSTSVLDGLTITGGHAALYTARGGGITCRPDSLPRIRRCFVRDNRSATHGGGIRCYLAAPLIEDCRIESNSADHEGGGIHCDWSAPAIRRCAINDNEAFAGGGVASFWLSDPELVSCVVDSNRADGLGGGIAWTYESAGSVLACSLRGNQALKGGAGAGYDSSPEIIDCEIVGCTAEDGGGFHFNDGNPVIDDSRLVGNRAEDDGGALLCLAAVTLTRCTLLANHAASEGGVASVGEFDNGGWISMDHCSLAGNRADYRGDVLSGSYSSATLSSCIAWANGPRFASAGYLFTVTVHHSDIAGGWPGEGNIGSIRDSVMLHA